MELIDNALDALSATESMQKLRFGNILVKQLMLDVIEQIDKELKQEFTIQVDISETLIVWSNQIYLRRILQNLLTNACKYSPRSTTIRVNAIPWAQQKRGTAQQYLCISIQDEGPGIPKDEQPQLFRKFSRLRRDYSGSIRGGGLGLYICKQCVQALGGEIWVESSGVPGQGSCFRFTIPIEAPRQYSIETSITPAEPA